MDLISNLIDIKTALDIKNKSKKQYKDKSSGRTMKKILEESPLDTDYKNLNCSMDPLETSSKDYKMIETYIENGSCTY